MANERTDALSILSDSAKDKLTEVYGGVIESVMKNSLSVQFKNTMYSGDPKAGSVEISRFTNSAVKNYGTARTAGKGDQLNNKGKVTINLNQNKEITEEFNKTDIEQIATKDIVERRLKNHANMIITELDRKFFEEATNTASEVEVNTVNELDEKLEMLIQSLETLKNDYVDGVNRDLMQLSLTPKAYGKLRKYIDKAVNANVTTAEEAINLFHGVRVYSNHRQTADAILMVNGAIAQPTVLNEYEAEKIPLSNEYAIQMFIRYGTKAITPDLIKKVTTLA